MISERRIYYVDSSKRVTGTNSRFSYIIDMNGVEYEYAAVLQANIPKSYYLVEEGYNYFFITENDILIPITVPPGNYTRSSLKKTIVPLMIENSLNEVIYDMIIPASGQPDDGKYLYTSDKPEIKISIILTTNLYEALGFNKDSVNTFVGGKLKSTNVIKLQIEDTIYIHSDLCTNGNDNILQEIFTVSSPDYGNIVFQTPSYKAYSKRIISTTSNIFHFYLTDENDQEIELNGLNCSFTIVLYKNK